MTMTKGQAEIFNRLDEIAEQGRQNASKLELIRQNLFGSEEDHYEAGRLPILERGVADLAERVKPLETTCASHFGERNVWHMVMVAGGKLLLAAAAALAGAIFGAHHR